MTRNTLTTTADIFNGVPVSDTRSRRVGFWIVFVTFGVFGSWAAFAPLDSAAYAPGVVTVQTYRKTVQHLEGGIVKDVLVHDGDIVKKGDPIIVLDDGQLKAEYETTYSQLIAAKPTPQKSTTDTIASNSPWPEPRRRNAGRDQKAGLDQVVRERAYLL